MESCSKYEKFSPNEFITSNNGKKNSIVCSSRCSVWMIIACIIAMSAAMILLSIATLTIIFHEDQPENHDKMTTTYGSMSNMSATRDEFKGTYTASGAANNKSIRMHCIATAKAFRMEITSGTGESVFTAFHYMSTNMTIISINSTNFFIRKNDFGSFVNDSKYDDYIIPDELAMNMTMSMMNNEQEMGEDELKLLHKELIEETRHSVIYALAMSDEGKLIIEAAQALGYDHNMQGIEYPVIMKFYILALRIARIRNDTKTMVPKPESNVNHTAKKQVRREVQCEAYDTTCPNKALCPYASSLYGNDCLGLCGYECHCWKFVCGDCCIHEYCLTHDRCCSVKKFLSWDCLSASWNKLISSCDDTYDCS